jgi:NAD(P)-dependent dehydrogenase (short-subunit alcohol dehydrogenase family)
MAALRDERSGKGPSAQRASPSRRFFSSCWRAFSTCPSLWRTPRHSPRPAMSVRTSKTSSRSRAHADRGTLQRLGSHRRGRSRRQHQRGAACAAVPDVDILVNNARAIPSGTLFDVDEARWRTAWDLKVLGTINMTRAFYPLMKARGGGGSAFGAEDGGGGAVGIPRGTGKIFGAGRLSAPGSKEGSGRARHVLCGASRSAHPQ